MPVFLSNGVGECVKLIYSASAVNQYVTSIKIISGVSSQQVNFGVAV